MPRLRLGLVLHREFHERGRWVSALTPRLIDELLRRHDVCWIGSQEEYEQNLGDLDVIFSCEPGWAAPRIDFSRTRALAEKLASIPSYITFSDPHDNRWRERYFLKSGLGHVLGYYKAPTLHHFRRLPAARLVHFPWAVPDDWIGREPIRYRGGERIACFGASQHEAYTVRNWCRGFPFVDSTSNSGVENKVMTDEEYAAWLGTLDAAIAAGSDDPRYLLTTPKYFEIAAAGALLFAQWTEDLADLGFEHGVNCLVFDRGSFEPLARDYLAHPEDFLPLREAGRELIRRRHSLSVRLDEWEHHVEETREALARRRPGRSAPAAPRKRGRERRRPRLLFVVDAPGWAHDIKTENLARALGDRFEIVRAYQEKLRARELDRADLIFVYYWMQVSHLERLGAAFERNRHKLVCGICSHQELEGDRREEGLAVLRRARALFANSLLLWREVSALAGQPVFYTPNGVDTAFFTPGGAHPDRPELVAGWAGSLGNFGPDERGYTTCLLPAVERVPGVRLETAAREERWRGAAEMREFYRSLDVYVCASRAEGTPNPCLEAASCGVPVVTTPVGNMPEFIEEGVSGLFIDRDPASLAGRLALLRDAPALRAALGRGARRAAERWDWRCQAENYAAMAESLLGAAEGTASEPRDEEALFRSAADLYLASADRIDRVEGNLAELERHPAPRGGRYATVVGGLSGLNYLLRAAPQQILFFDLNLAALDYARLIVELIAMSQDHRDFTGRIFGRPVARFLEEEGEPELTLGNQQRYLARPPDEALVAETRRRLSARSRRTFDATLAPHLPGRVLDGVRNCRRLLPCWPAGQRVPVGGGLACGDDEWGRSVPNTNTLFYGHGWLASAETFRAVRRALASAELHYAPLDLLRGEFDLLSGGRSTAPDPLLLHVSNIDDWFPERFAAALERWERRCLTEQRPLTVITAHNGIRRLAADPHAWALSGLAPFVFGRVVEVTHRVPWGFHELERANVAAEAYAERPPQADTAILHILAGEGLPHALLRRCYRAALASASRVLLLEHDPASADWDDAARARMIDRAALLALIEEERAAGRRGLLTALRDLRGTADGRRNVLAVVDVVPEESAAAAGRSERLASGTRTVPGGAAQG